jgi:hypothetical protein
MAAGVIESCLAQMNEPEPLDCTTKWRLFLHGSGLARPCPCPATASSWRLRHFNDPIFQVTVPGRVSPNSVGCRYDLYCFEIEVN